MTRKIVLGAATAAMAFAPPMAAGATDRAAAPVEGEQEFAGRSLIIAVLAAAAIVAGIIIIADDDEDEPISA